MVQLKLAKPLKTNCSGHWRVALLSMVRTACRQLLRTYMAKLRTTDCWDLAGLEQQTVPDCGVTEDVPAEAVQEAAHPPAAADGEPGEGVHLV